MSCLLKFSNLHFFSMHVNLRITVQIFIKFEIGQLDKELSICVTCHLFSKSLYIKSCIHFWVHLKCNLLNMYQDKTHSKQVLEENKIFFSQILLFLIQLKVCCMCVHVWTYVMLSNELWFILLGSDFEGTINPFHEW